MNFKETKQDGRNIFKKGGNRMRMWSGDKSQKSLWNTVTKALDKKKKKNST